ncbi:unnamed protein product [Cuscuta campestris]|uniref:Reverse transcriptase domain-containing protein n=1 Tax=Cuscuta campestris TaxID=132261 RepID=A0A484N430_9ASTE|nr:unnamed protein product [Cuscuta campestris]
MGEGDRRTGSSMGEEAAASGVCKAGEYEKGRAGNENSLPQLFAKFAVTKKALFGVVNFTYLGSYNTCNHPLISHFAFADDLVVFLNGDTRNLKKFRRILEDCQKGSGQQVNLNKSSFYTGKKTFVKGPPVGSKDDEDGQHA